MAVEVAVATMILLQPHKVVMEAVVVAVEVLKDSLPEIETYLAKLVLMF